MRHVPVWRRRYIESDLCKKPKGHLAKSALELFRKSLFFIHWKRPLFQVDSDSFRQEDSKCGLKDYGGLGASSSMPDL